MHPLNTHQPMIEMTDDEMRAEIAAIDARKQQLAADEAETMRWREPWKAGEPRRRELEELDRRRGNLDFELGLRARRSGKAPRLPPPFGSCG